MKKLSATLLAASCLLTTAKTAYAADLREACPAVSAGNPFAEGWYADPDMKVYDGTYWVYPTYSAPSGEQTFLDAFSSRDLIHWTKHSRILDRSNVSWANRSIWAPSPVYRHGQYYLYFGANDLHNENEIGGIGVAVADNPAGPFVDPLGHPLIGKIINGAIPIDQNVFVDDDGSAYIYYGGNGHVNVARLNDDMVSLGQLPDGNTFREITPPGYTEGALMFKRQGIYYFMWSEGAWTGPDYRVSYAMASSPLGPFNKVGTILSQNSNIATGSGHHTVVNVPGTEDWYIFYHRRPLGATNHDHRVLAYDAMYFNADGTIKPVKMTSKDNFCDGNDIGWKRYGGIWSASAGQYSVYSRQDAKSLMNTNFSALNYEAEVSVGTTGDAGLMFRVSNPTDSLDGYRGYYVGIDAHRDLLFLGKANSPGWQELASSPQSIDPERMYRLRVVATESRIEVFFNGSNNPVLSVSDSTYSSGMTGLRAFKTTARFDNVKVDNPLSAVFYTDGDYLGTAVALSPGMYTLSQLMNAGLPNDAVTSMRIPKGWTVQIYQDDHFAGTRWNFSGDTVAVPPEVNDQMSSVRIFGN